MRKLLKRIKEGATSVTGLFTIAGIIPLTADIAWLFLDWFLETMFGHIVVLPIYSYILFAMILGITLQIIAMRKFMKLGMLKIEQELERLHKEGKELKLDGEKDA